MSELEQEIFNTLTNHSEYFIQDDIPSMLIRKMVWGFIKLLMWLVDLFQQVILEIWDLPEFFYSDEMKELTNIFSVAMYSIGTLALTIYVIRRILNPDIKIKSFIDSLLLGIGTVLLSGMLIGQILTISTNISKELITTESGNQFVYEVINKTGTDTLKALKTDNFEPDSTKINLTTNNIDYFDYAQVLNEDYLNEQAKKGVLEKEDWFKTLNYEVTLNANNQLTLVEANKGSWFGLPKSYYRYNFNTFGVVGYLISYLLAVAISIIKFIKLFFEIFFNQTLLPLFAFSDFNGAKGLKTILNNIKNAILVMILCGLSLKVFTALQVWLIQRDINVVTLLIIQIGLALAVVDGANISQQLTGYDAGLKSAGASLVAGAGVGWVMSKPLRAGAGYVGTKTASGVQSIGKTISDKIRQGRNTTSSDNSGNNNKTATEAKDQYVQSKTNSSNNLGVGLGSNQPKADISNTNVSNMNNTNKANKANEQNASTKSIGLGSTAQQDGKQSTVQPINTIGSESKGMSNIANNKDTSMDKDGTNALSLGETSANNSSLNKGNASMLNNKGNRESSEQLNEGLNKEILNSQQPSIKTISNQDAQSEKAMQSNTTDVSDYHSFNDSSKTSQSTLSNNNSKIPMNTRSNGLMKEGNIQKQNINAKKFENTE